MEVDRLLEAMEAAHSTITKSKEEYNFVYGLNDCFCLFLEYDKELYGTSDFEWVDWTYHNRWMFFKQLRRRGIELPYGVISRSNRYELGVPQPKIGDIAAIVDLEGALTTVIYHGDYWINSNLTRGKDLIKHETVMSNIVGLARPKDPNNEST